MSNTASKTVDDAIKIAYAKLAKQLFLRAEKTIICNSELNLSNIDQIMEHMEKYLKKAGAHATKWHSQL